ncbi:MAG: hypothetical protein ACFCVG_08055 [Kineosporiaceae bacterium]
MKAPRWLRIVGWIFLVFLIYAIFNSPQDAANIVVAAIEGIAALFGAVFAFFDALIGELQTTGLVVRPAAVTGAVAAVLLPG